MRLGLIEKAVRTRALYQGTTSVVPKPIPKTLGFSPCHHFLAGDSSDQHLAQVQTRQGLKARSLFWLCGTTEVVP